MPTFKAETFIDELCESNIRLKALFRLKWPRLEMHTRQCLWVVHMTIIPTRLSSDRCLGGASRKNRSNFLAQETLENNAQAVQAVHAPVYCSHSERLWPRVKRRRCASSGLSDVSSMSSSKLRRLPVLKRSRTVASSCFPALSHEPCNVLLYFSCCCGQSCGFFCCISKIDEGLQYQRVWIFNF
jgi:hypothetical protein